MMKITLNVAGVETKFPKTSVGLTKKEDLIIIQFNELENIDYNFLIEKSKKNIFGELAYIKDQKSLILKFEDEKIQYVTSFEDNEDLINLFYSGKSLGFIYENKLKEKHKDVICYFN